ncbi:MAG: sodium-dependent transporter [Candidatus Ozemobacteraceae bacterium]
MSENSGEPKREHWGSRVGLILAMAGNAVGLGNFLRFPAKAAANGGGAFMIPYFIAFIILGIPLMWIEWGIGRYGGSLGHGTMPGVLHKMVKNKAWKYLGVFGIVLPLFIAVYYNYIESWTLSYSYFSVKGEFSRIQGKDLAERKLEMNRFFKEFQGIKPTVKVPVTLDRSSIQKIEATVEESQVNPEFRYQPSVHGDWDPMSSKLDQSKKPYQEISLKGKYFDGANVAYLFFLITFFLNSYFLYRGLSAGIEQLGKVGMPILFVFATILAIRVISLGRPEGSAFTIADGFNFLWVPKFSELGSAAVWLAAAGQIFFTLSVGQGSIMAYSSYLSEKDDVVLTGLATASLNEFAEVVLGGTIAIPAAVAFFGPEMTVNIAKAGAFDLGFQSLPMIFSQISFGWFFGTIWFALLFIAGITSSVALLTPAITFLKDELKISHGKAVLGVCFITFIFAHGCVYFVDKNVIDEIDYWAGTFGLVAFALLEVILFLWVFGSKNAMEEMHHGADIQIPWIFEFIMKYVTPLYIMALFMVWGVQDGWATLVMSSIPVADRPYIWGTRLLMILVTALFIHFIWLRFKDDDKEPYTVPMAFWGIPLLVHIAAFPGLLPIDTNALLMLVCSWGSVISLSLYCVVKMASVPAAKHADFIDELPK